MLFRKKILSALILTFAAISAVAADGPIDSGQAQQIALDQAGGGRIVELDRHNRHDGLIYYRVVVLGDDGAYQMEIDERNGKVIQLIRKSGYTERTVLQNDPATTGVLPAGGQVTREQALDIALGQTGGGTVVESEVDHKRHGRIIHEFEILNNGTKYEVEVDGATGNIVEFKQRHNFGTAAALPSRLDMAAAQAIARERAGGGDIVKYELDNDHDRLVHEITVLNGGVRHKMKIDDADGQVIKYKID